jgi:phospholipase/carboxylesterase
MAAELVQRVRPSERGPDGALVLFHGRGASELDLFPLFDELDPGRRLVGVAPRGPLRLPPGGYHWYALHRIGFPDRDTFLAAYELTSAWLDELPETTGVPLARTIVGGFSQGAVMTYALSLGHGRPSRAGVIALSGFIPTVDGFELDLESRAGLPVAIGHGIYDQVIDVEWSRRARDLLVGAGLDVTYREAPLPHTVDPEFVVELRGWVSQALARAGAST